MVDQAEQERAAREVRQKELANSIALERETIRKEILRLADEKDQVIDMLNGLLE